jgi:RNA polymerase sigma-B factor
MEQRVLDTYRTTTSSEVREQILTQYSDLVLEVMPPVPQQQQADLVRIGHQALDTALHDFDTGSGEDFCDYARLCISNHLNRYLSQQHKSSQIKETTVSLFLEYQDQPSVALRNRLVEVNIGLVRKEAHHWINQCHESFDDLMQVGTIGLIRAIERFEVGKGYAFSSFAIPYIRGEIQHYLRDKSPTLRVPRSWLSIHEQALGICRRWRSQKGRDPSEGELVTELGISSAEWQEVKLACQNRTPVSLDSQIKDHDDQSICLGDLITDHRYRSFQLAQEDSLRLQQALEQLEERTRQVVEFVFLKEFTYKEASEAMGISVVTVSRRLKKGLEILKKIMTSTID